MQSPQSPVSGILIRVVEKRWLIAIWLVCGWIAGTVLGWVLPPKYRSETVILIEQQKVPEHYVEPNVVADMQQRLQSMSQQILSRTRLVGLIDKFGLYHDGSSSRDPDALVDRMRADINIETITTEGRRDQLSAFKVSYSAPTPFLAKAVTTELTSLFINENLQSREQLSQDTTSFLQNQLDEARQSLSEQEERLRQFRTEHLGELPEQLQGNLQILGGLQGQLQAATDALHQAQQQNLYLRSLIRQYQPANILGAPDGTGEDSGSRSTQQSQLAALQTQLAEFEGRYTSRHPDVLRLRQQIAELEAEQSKTSATDARETGAQTTGPFVTSTENSPLIQLSGQLSANELEIKNQKEKIGKIERQVEIYQSRLNVTPAREQQSTAVTRDYDQSRAYYDALLSKKLQSEMATNLEKRRQGAQFRVIDAPNLPGRPYWPNRLLCSLAGLGAGLVLGFGVVFAFDRISPTIYQESELAEFIGSGYVVGLPTFSTEQELARASWRRKVELTAASVLAVMVPVVTVVSYFKH